jgi:hypothetical protein
MSPYTPRTSPLDNKHLADNIDIKRISSKGHFHEGSSFTSPKAKGLKGQLGKMYREHKFGSTKNLSRKNLKDISDLISKQMKKGLPFSKVGLTRQMGEKIMHEAWKKVKTDPTFSRSDRKDLKVIVEAIKEKSRGEILKKPDGSTKSIGAEKIEAAKNPAGRLPNQTINKDNNLKISSDSLLNSILVKPIDNRKPLDRKETLMKLRRTGSNLESTEQTKTNNIQAPTNKPSTSTPEKNNIKAPFDPFLNSLLAKTNDGNTPIPKPKTSTTGKPLGSPKIINNQTIPNKPLNTTSIKDIENGILVKNLQNSTISEPTTIIPKIPTDKSFKPTKTNDVVTLEDNQQNTKSETIKNNRPLTETKTTNNNVLPNQPININSIKDIENGILVKNLQNSVTNKPTEIKPEPIDANDALSPEDNNESVEPKAKTGTNKPAKPTENKTTQTPTKNPENLATNETSDTELESTEDKSSEPTKKTAAEIAEEEALRKLKIKRNIASARSLTRMVDERDKSNNNGQPLPSDPENSTGDKSAKPTTEPIISGSAKPRKDTTDQPITEQFLDVDSIDYLTELAQKLGEPQQNTQPIIPQKQAGISEVAEKAEDMNI